MAGAVGLATGAYLIYLAAHGTAAPPQAGLSILLYSSCAAAVLAFGTLYFGEFARVRELEGRLNLRPSNRIYIRETSGSEIRRQINEVPWTDTERRLSSYSGKWLRARGTIRSIYRNLWYLQIWLDDGGMILEYWIWDRARLEQLKPGDLIEYEGRIAKVDILHITVTRPTFSLVLNQQNDSRDKLYT